MRNKFYIKEILNQVQNIPIRFENSEGCIREKAGKLKQDQYN